MLTAYSPKLKIAYEKLTQEEYMRRFLTGEITSFAFISAGRNAVEITDRSSLEARAKRDYYFKRYGVIPFNSLKEMMEIADEVEALTGVRRIAEYKANKERRKKK